MDIFIVDDSKPLRRSLRGLLADIPGTQVAGEAADVRQAVAGILASQPDMVILDIRLSDGSGLEVLRSVRAQAPATRFIVFTGCPANPYKELVLNEGAAYFFEKSIEEEKLLGCIQSLLASATPHLRAKRQETGPTL